MNESVENPETELELRGRGDTGRQREELVSVEATAWTGPLPKPDDLREYEDILPGGGQPHTGAGGKAAGPIATTRKE